MIANFAENDKSKTEKFLDEIKNQLEFYFSDENLLNDKFMQERLKIHKGVSINEIFKFNKIKKLLT